MDKSAASRVMYFTNHKILYYNELKMGGIPPTKDYTCNKPCSVLRGIFYK